MVRFSVCQLTGWKLLAMARSQSQSADAYCMDENEREDLSHPLCPFDFIVNSLYAVGFFGIYFRGGNVASSRATNQKGNSKCPLNRKTMESLLA